MEFCKLGPNDIACKTLESGMVFPLHVYADSHFISLRGIPTRFGGWVWGRVRAWNQDVEVHFLSTLTILYVSITPAYKLCLLSFLVNFYHKITFWELGELQKMGFLKSSFLLTANKFHRCLTICSCQHNFLCSVFPFLTYWTVKASISYSCRLNFFVPSDSFAFLNTKTYGKIKCALYNNKPRNTDVSNLLVQKRFFSLKKRFWPNDTGNFWSADVRLADIRDNQNFGDGY